GFCPPERLRVGVMLFDERGDSGLQGDDAAVNAAPDLAFGQQSEEALHLIDPGGTGWCQMHVPARAPIEPVSDQRSFVGCVIVDDQMYVEVGWPGGFGLIEQLAEFDGAMAGITLADHPAGSDVERGEQRCGAMALVVMAAARRLAGTH